MIKVTYLNISRNEYYTKGYAPPRKLFDFMNKKKQTTSLNFPRSPIELLHNNFHLRT